MLASGYALIMDPVAVAPKKGRRGRRGRKEARKGGAREVSQSVDFIIWCLCILAFHRVGDDSQNLGNSAKGWKWIEESLTQQPSLRVLFAWIAAPPSIKLEAEESQALPLTTAGPSEKLFGQNGYDKIQRFVFWTICGLALGGKVP